MKAGSRELGSRTVQPPAAIAGCARELGARRRRFEPVEGSASGGRGSTVPVRPSVVASARPATAWNPWCPWAADYAASASGVRLDRVHRCSPDRGTARSRGRSRRRRRRRPPTAAATRDACRCRSTPAIARAIAHVVGDTVAEALSLDRYDTGTHRSDRTDARRAPFSRNRKITHTARTATTRWAPAEHETGDGQSVYR